MYRYVIRSGEIMNTDDIARELDALLTELNTAETATHVADICLREKQLLQRPFIDAASHVVAYNNYVMDKCMDEIASVLWPAGYDTTKQWEMWYDYATQGEW